MVSLKEINHGPEKMDIYFKSKKQEKDYESYKIQGYKYYMTEEDGTIVMKKYKNIYDPAFFLEEIKIKP